MAKKHNQQKKRSSIVASLVEKTADVTNVSKRSVQRVIQGDQNNEKVLSVFMYLQEGENALIQEVKKLDLFNEKVATA